MGRTWYLPKNRRNSLLTLFLIISHTTKTGPNTYKKNYVYLNDYTLYVLEDITGTHTDPYHYVMYFHTEIPYVV